MTHSTIWLDIIFDDDRDIPAPVVAVVDALLERAVGRVRPVDVGVAIAQDHRVDVRATASTIGARVVVVEVPFDPARGILRI